MDISPGVVGSIGLVVLVVLLFGRMWIGFAMAVVGFLGFAYVAGFTPALMVLATVPYSTLADYSMSVIPLFILMAVIVSDTGIGEDLYRSANAWVGPCQGVWLWLPVPPAPLLLPSVVRAPAGTITMGKVAVPEMRKYHYDESLSTACVAAGGTLGILIPPSLGFILYAILTEQSIGKLFIAGILPGILLTLLFIIIIGVTAWIKTSHGTARSQRQASSRR